MLIHRFFYRHKNVQKEGLISKSLRLVSPSVIFLDRLGLGFILKFVMVMVIRVYQKYLSPSKGFSCAYAILNASDSCSEYFRKTVISHGTKKSIPLLQRRLRECKLAHTELKAKCECSRLSL
jgi:putative component of membrane protein insertase Oxa1/YidC/SpoIIIJ protein YidD